MKCGTCSVDDAENKLWDEEFMVVNEYNEVEDELLNVVEVLENAIRIMVWVAYICPTQQEAHDHSPAVIRTLDDVTETAFILKVDRNYKKRHWCN